MGVLLPIVACALAFYVVRPTYSAGTFTLQGFTSRYGAEVYRYRVLGPLAVLALVHRGWTVYDALFVVTASGAVVFGALVTRDLLAVSRSVVEAVVIVAAFGATLGVITPYDGWSYAAIAAGCSLLRHPTWAWSLAALAATMVFGTLVRETQALVVSLAVAQVLTGRPDLRQPVTAAAAFGLTYFTLRLAFGWHKGIANYWTFPSEIRSVAGVATLAGGAVALAMMAWWQSRPDRPREARRVVWSYVFTAPYLIAILGTGHWVELRLLMPLLIVQTYASMPPPDEPAARPTTV